MKDVYTGGFDDSNFFEAVEKLENVKDSKKRKEILEYYVQKDVKKVFANMNQNKAD